MMSARWRPFWSATAHATSPAILLLSIAAPMFWGEGTVLARLVLIVQESCTIESLAMARFLSRLPAERLARGSRRDCQERALAGCQRHPPKTLISVHRSWQY